jgi:phosphoglycolate phosphatase
MTEEGRQLKAVLFDIDGTLMVGHGAGTRAMTRAGQAICGAAFDLAGILIGGSLDPIIFHEAALGMGLEDPLSLHDAFRERYLIELAAELLAAERRAHILPGVLDLLALLAQRSDVAVGLVTGNYQLAVPIKFDVVGLPMRSFVAGGFGDDAPTRPGLVRVALERMRSALGVSIAAEDVIVVGDTPRDVDCALQNGCRCLAVGTGTHSLDELRQAGAQRVAAGLDDPQVLLSWL